MKNDKHKNSKTKETLKPEENKEGMERHNNDYREVKEDKGANLSDSAELDFNAVVDINGGSGRALAEQELASKEAKLQELWDKDRALVEATGKEMSLLISAVDNDEDEKHLVQKEVTSLESQMRSIQDQLTRIQERRDQLVQDLHKKDEKLNESLKKKRILEDFIAQEVDANKQAKLGLEREIEFIKTRMEDMDKESQSEKVNEIKPEIQKFLDNINRKIDAKERDLECSICLEVSSAPIYCCDEQHIICSDCRPKVTICPECREPYPSKPRRHRYAEKAAEELDALMLERAEILDSS